MVESAQAEADLLATSKLFQTVFQGDAGATVIEIMEKEAGLTDVWIPGQGEDVSKPAIDPLGLAVREGRRQMVNLIRFHLEWEENKREEAELRAQQAKEILDGSERSA